MSKCSTGVQKENRVSFFFLIFILFFLFSVFVNVSCYAMLCYAKSRQSWPTLCDSIDGSPAGSPVPGILQARTLEWVAISFSNA